MRRFFMFRSSKLFLQLAAIALVLTVAHKSVAYQSRYLVSTLGNICENTDPKKITGSFKIKNLTDQPLMLQVPSLRNDEFQFRFIADQKVLRPQQEATIHFRGAIFAEGKHQVIANVEIMNVNGERISSQQV